MLKKFKEIIKQYCLINENDKIIVGLSGGPDSVCLFYLLCSLREEFKFDIIAAHLDHGWRATSQQDVVFCKQLAEKYNVPFVSKHASKIVLKKKLYGSSKEELGRTLRRQFFAELLKLEQANSIALAHHWDDQVETFFIRLMRGCTITGLSGMHIKQDCYIRPLLNFTKDEILNFLHTENLRFLIDETNEFDLFLRNKIRKYLVPIARDIDSRFDLNLKKTIGNIQETNQFITRLLDMHFQETAERANDNYKLNKDKFLSIDPYLQKNIVIMWLCKNKVQFPLSNAFLTEILKFIKQPKSGEHKLNPEWSIVKEQQWLRIKLI